MIGKAADAGELLRLVERRRPTSSWWISRCPPTHTDEGRAAAQEIGERQPDIGVLVLSQYSSRYLLKDRVADVAVLADALHRIAEGKCVIDPTIVSRLFARGRAGPLEQLTEREREVLALLAEGRMSGSSWNFDGDLRVDGQTVTGSAAS